MDSKVQFSTTALPAYEAVLQVTVLLAQAVHVILFGYFAKWVRAERCMQQATAALLLPSPTQTPVDLHKRQ